ncbi:MAG: hypothetical protein HRU40_02250 [Saprospiraceae bacterium]|nr:hypothetical protein [Saprospiraceae bacterium]
MNNSKLIELLQSFSKPQIQGFEKYMVYESTSGKSSRSAVALYRLLQKQKFHLPNSWDKERVWSKLFPNQAFSDLTLRKLMHEINHNALTFLGMEQIKKHPQLFRQMMLEATQEKSLSKHTNTLKKQSQKYFSTEADRDAKFHYNLYLYNRLHYLEAEKARKRDQLTDLLKQMDYQLECHYLTNKLRHYCDSISNRVFFALDGEELTLPSGFLDTILEGPYVQEISVKVYALIAKMLEEPEQEQWFRRVKNLLHSLSDKFSSNEQDALYIFLKNYCIGYQINQGNSSYFHELFDISKTLLDKGVTQRNGDITPQAYKNIITVGLYVNEFDWTESFIRDFTDLLPESDRQNALNYNLAKVFFAQKKYPQVIEQLREVAYANHTYALGSKLMLIKTYFELNEDRALDSLIDSFRIYLRRNRTISKEVRQQYSSILRFIKKLLYLPPGSNKARTALRKEIEASEPVADKDWILEKVT